MQGIAETVGSAAHGHARGRVAHKPIAYSHRRLQWKKSERVL